MTSGTTTTSTCTASEVDITARRAETLLAVLLTLPFAPWKLVKRNRTQGAHDLNKAHIDRRMCVCDRV